MKKLTNKVYTIKQNNPSKLRYERKLECKYLGCPSIAKMITFYDTDETYLWICKSKNHSSQCTYKDKLGNLTEEDRIFEDPSFKILVSSTLPPKQVIQTYNKDRKAKGLFELPILSRITKKISRIRHDLNSKDNDIPHSLVVNMNELKAEVQRASFADDELSNIPEDTVFVAGSHFTENKFCVVLTSKTLLKNYLTQGKYAPRFLAVDGTYKLNDLKYPTLVLGTVDVNRKFHLSNFSLFHFLMYY